MKNEPSPNPNPIAAVNKLKSVKDNIETMRNRYLVLRMRDEYHKSRTMDQERRLNLHQMIHERLKNEREELRKSLEEIRDTKEVKERTQSIRKQVREGVASAKKHVYCSNLEKYEQITGEAAKNRETIDLNREREESVSKERALSLKKAEEMEREAIERKLRERRARILASKAEQSSELKQKSAEGQQLVQRLQKDEMQLIKQTSKSIQHSRLMSQRYTEVMMNLPTRNKRSQKSQRLSSSFLPEIHPRNPSMHIVMV